MYITILTHNGIFHADELVAIALLKSAYATEKDYVQITRVPHQYSELDKVKETNEANGIKTFLVDIGKSYDPDNGLFDHHQFTPAEETRASAGLVLDWLKKIGKLNDYAYNKLKPIVGMVDENDIGIKPAQPGELPWVIANLNANDPYGKEQWSRFDQAISLCYTLVKNIIERSLLVEEDKKKLLEDCYTYKHENFTALISRVGYIPTWTESIHEVLDKKYKHADFFIWYDKEQDKWKAQNIPSKEDPFKPLGKKIMYTEPLPEGIEFVHKGNFFMVAKSLDDIIKYLEEHAG